ncbi:MAG: T9SS type A sorting domain-containing protein [Bacteroidia bacterium]|nr:T9SS type A sorting domain-containing protein [Bacteroidia bacterium]
MKNLFLFAACLLIALSAVAQRTFYTSGKGTGEWSDAQSWVVSGEAGVPTAADHVVINHYLTHYATSGYTHRGNITVNTTGSYEIVSGFEQPADYVFAGQHFEVAGTLISTGDLTVRPAANGELQLLDGAFVVISRTLRLYTGAEVAIENGSCGALTVGHQVELYAGSRLCGAGKLTVYQGVKVWTDTGREIADAEAARTEAARRMCEGLKLFTDEIACEAGQPLVTGGLAQLSGVTMYPNPSTDGRVYVFAESLVAGESVRLSLRSQMGQEIEALAALADENGILDVTFDLHVSPGLYLMVIEGEDLVRTLPLVIK